MNNVGYICAVCTQSIVVHLIFDFKVAIYNILLPIAYLVFEGEGQAWRTPESLKNAFNACEKEENL